MNAAHPTSALALTLSMLALETRPATAQAPTVAETASQAASVDRPADVPWEVGERLDYEVRLGPIGGSAFMEVRGIEDVRGTPTYHTVFEVKGGIPFFRVHDVFQSWIGVNDLASYRFHQDQDEGPKERRRRYEIYPDRQVYTEQVTAEGEEQPSVANPLDDGSFLYFIRTVPLRVGSTYEFHRYFRPDRNPVTIRVLRKEQIRVPAGTFDAVVIQPIIKAKGLFSEGGRAEIWISDDDDRVMLQMKSRLSIGTLTLRLRNVRPGGGPTGS